MGLLSFLIKLFTGKKASTAPEQTEQPKTVLPLKYDIVFDEEEYSKTVRLPIDENTGYFDEDGNYHVKTKVTSVELPRGVTIKLIHENGQSVYRWNPNGSGIVEASLKIAGITALGDREAIFIYDRSFEEVKLVPAAFLLQPLEFVLNNHGEVIAVNAETPSYAYRFNYSIRLPSKRIENILPPRNYGNIEEVTGAVEQAEAQDYFLVTVDLSEITAARNRLKAKLSQTAPDVDTRPPQVIREILTWVYPEEHLVTAEKSLREKPLNRRDEFKHSLDSNFLVELYPIPHSSLSAFVMLRVDDGEWQKIIEYSDDAYAVKYYGKLDENAERIYIEVYFLPRGVINPVAFRGAKFEVHQDRRSGEGYAYERTVVDALKNLENSTAGIMFYRDRPDRYYTVRISLHETAEIKWANAVFVYEAGDAFKVKYYPTIKIDDANSKALRNNVSASIIVVDKYGVTKYRRDFVTEYYMTTFDISKDVFGEDDRLIIRTHGVVKDDNRRYLLFVWNAGDIVYKYSGGRLIEAS